MKRNLTFILAGLSFISGVMTSGAVLMGIFFNHDNWSYWTVFLLSLLLSLSVLSGMLWLKRKILPIIYAISGIIIFELTICFIIVLISLIGYGSSVPLRLSELIVMLAIMWILVAWGICILISVPLLFKIRYPRWFETFSFIVSIIAILLAINLFIAAFISAFYGLYSRIGPEPSVGFPFMIASVIIFITAIIYLVRVIKERRKDPVLPENVAVQKEMGNVDVLGVHRNIIATLKFNCPKCHQEVGFKYLKKGEIGQCPKCSSQIIVSEDAVQID